MSKKSLHLIILYLLLFLFTACSSKERTEINSSGNEMITASASETVSEAPAEKAPGSDLEEKTLASFEKLADGIYIMDCYTDYKLEEYLSADITDVEKFDIWMTENLTHGIPTGDIPGMGCSSFAITGTNGGHLFARNYDMRKNGDSLIIRTCPDNGYASIGIVDLAHINLGRMGKYDPEDDNGRKLLFAAPWCICDGINEKGLGASLLSLNNSHTVTDTDKPDLLLYSALRLIIDRCASVDEAVKMLESYDIYSPGHHSYHLFLTDTTGQAVTVEWTEEGKMAVINDTAVTNFLLYLNRPTLDYDQRYTKIHRNIDETESMTEAEAMSVLKTVSSETQWSAVYDLESFSLKVCFNMDFGNTFSYQGTVPGSAKIATQN